MTPAFRRLAWAAAVATYALIVLGAWVRITGSGMGCGDDWPLCHGRLFPPLDDLGTLIEWTHRLGAVGVNLELPHGAVVLPLGPAMLLLAALFAWALGGGGGRPATAALAAA